MRFLKSILCLLTTLSATASVELNTSINDLAHRGSHELTGSITFLVDDDDFHEASEIEPIFIRITTDHNSYLAHTLVEQNSSDTLLQQPVYLAMSLNSADPNATIVADPASVSIVRWVAGESSIWLRVQTSSDDWISSGGMTLGPSVEHEVKWTIGVNARLSDERNSQILGHPSNLPFNTRDITAVENEFAKATSTLICSNLSESNLAADGTSESLLQFDIIAYDENADVGSGIYSGNAGNDTGINFTNDFVIARGKERFCETIDQTISDPVAMTVENLPNEMTSASASWQLSLFCDNTVNFLDQDLVEGSYLDLRVDDGVSYGIGEASITGLPTHTEYEDPFQVNGQTLYRRARIVFAGGFSLMPQRDIDVHIDLRHDNGQNIPDLSVDWSMRLLTHDGGPDDAPYDGNDQWRRCQPELLVTGEGSFNGLACVITRTLVSEDFVMLDSNCPITRDVYARSPEGDFILIAEDVTIDGETMIPLNEDTFFPGHTYGSVPTGSMPTGSNFVAAAAAAVPTLGEWSLLGLISLMLAAGILMRRRAH